MAWRPTGRRGGRFPDRLPGGVSDRLTQLLKLFSAETRAELFRGEMGEAYRDYETLRNMLYQNSVQALSPYRVAMP